MSKPRSDGLLGVRLAEWMERSWVGRRFDGFGSLALSTTLRTFEPGARVLLASAERDAERLLHLARGLLLVGFGLTALWTIGPNAVFAVVPVWFAAALLPAVGLWWLVWQVLRRPLVPSWLHYALVMVDAILAVRVVVLAGSPKFGLEGLLTHDEAVAVVGPLLLYVAVSGGFRLDPRIAAFSTVCALASYAAVAAAFGVSTRQAILVGVTIWLSGFVGAQAGRVVRMLALRAGEEAVLARYVPEALTRELARTGDPTGHGTEAEVTVLIVDIRGYTRRSEHLTPREAVAFLNDYFAIVVAQLAAEGAVLDKYIGDGVFSFFQGSDHASRALRAGRQILDAVERFNVERAGVEPLRVGIAVHTGQALVGTIGSDHKREYTVIADAVNVAARLEELNKHFNSAIVVSDDALRAAGREHGTGFVGPQTVELRGHGASLSVYYLPAPA